MYKSLIILFILIFSFGCSLSSKEGTIKKENSENLSQQNQVDSNSKKILIDGFESDVDWIVEKGEGTSINVNVVDGKFAKALKISYDLKDSKQWVGVHNNASDVNLTKYGSLKLWVKGSGAINNVEIKLVDMDNSSFIHVVPDVTKFIKWTSLIIPIKSFQYGWGGDKNLDEIKEIWISVTCKDGKKGTLALDNLEYISD